MPFRQDIQILRGLAVLLVVLFHFEIPFFGSGFLGVDIFFVISGFLMALLYNKGSVIDFYKRRIFRLLPAYAVTILATLLIGYFVLIPVDFNQLYDQTLSSAVFGSNVHFWYLNSYFDKSAFKPLLNLWSLGVEMQFYLIVPLLYPLVHRRKYLLWAAIISCFAACLVMTQISPKTSFFMMPFRVWEFLLGAWVAWGLAQGGKQAGAFIQLALLALLIAASMFLPVLADQKSWLWGHPGMVTLAVCVLTAGLIYTGMPKGLENSLMGRGLAKIGDYSYSIYLVHFPLIVLWNYEPFSGTILSADSGGKAFYMLGSIIISSYLLYNYIERNKAPAFKKLSFNALLLVITALSAIAGAYLVNQKYSAAEKNIFAAWEDKSTYRCGKVFRVLNPGERVCRLSALDNDERILLIGNSHADSIKTAMATAAEENSFSLYFYVFNDPLIKPEMLSAKVLEDIQRLEIDKIVLHYSNIYENEGHNQEIKTLIEQALDKGLDVAFIAPVPFYPVHVPKAMYQGVEIEQSFKDYTDNTSDFRNFARALDRRVRVYYPANILCPNKKQCLYASPDKKPYYYDSAHLTLTGAALLDDMFIEVVRN